ncbi:MAG: aminotransferase class I/II-fold pyridoxal phosphate-dependent enzyme, partial [Gammaproteobacteria bacterium]|nr:aminotransferase class I/II-fold pyridoxal phosphate-dependent enzyme [Gammaproteobacteria bacterium]
ASAEFAIKNRQVLDQQTQQICTDRETLFKDLSEIENITAYPSQANFILVRVADGKADGIFNTLKEQGVLIKNLNPVGGLLANCLRITVGTVEENKALLENFKKAL